LEESSPPGCKFLQYAAAKLADKVSIIVCSLEIVIDMIETEQPGSAAGLLLNCW
jgi:hypothetical protein